MASKEGPHLKASLRCGTAATWSSSCSSSAVWPAGVKEDRKKPAARARKPKRTSFACLECSKTFPTQQAMAGHCSAHTRAGARRVPASHLPAAAPVAAVVAAPSILPQLLPQHHHHHSVNAVQCWCPQVQVSPRTNPMPPPLAFRYVPYARPVSNQMVVRLPYLDLHARRSSRRLATTYPTTNAAFRPAAWPMPNVPASGRLGWRAFVPFYTVPSWSVNGAPPSDAVSSSTDRPGRTRAADLTLRLGSGREHAQKRTLPLLKSLVVSDGQQSADRKCKLVITDGGQRGDNGENYQNQMGGLDLELRLSTADWRDVNPQTVRL